MRVYTGRPMYLCMGGFGVEEGVTTLFMFFFP